jgi:hypothetical protein
MGSGRELARVWNGSPELEPSRTGQAVIIPVQLRVGAQNFQSAADQQGHEKEVAEMQRSKPEWKIQRVHTMPPLNLLVLVRLQR